jgi:hypothetical protein
MQVEKPSEKNRARFRGNENGEIINKSTVWCEKT